VETGWIPIGTMAAGSRWGMFHLFPDGTEVTVDFIGGDVNNGRIRCCYANTSDAPPAGLVQGEFLIKHSSGSYLRFLNSGDVELSPAALLKLAGGGPAIARVGDATTCPAGGGTIVSGSSKVTCG
jgi:phage gp45-like